MVKKSEMMMKDVIDINRGKKLGYIDDVDIDLSQGKISALIVPAASNKLFNLFTKKEDMVINWENIKKIGEDVILVDM